MPGAGRVFGGAHPGVAGGDGVPGRGVRFGDDLRAFDRDGFQPGGVHGVGGVRGGEPAQHQPVIGGGVLAVVPLFQPAAADRHQRRGPGR